MTEGKDLWHLSVIAWEEKVGMMPNGCADTLLSGAKEDPLPTVLLIGDINLNQFLISLFLHTG